MPLVQIKVIEGVLTDDQKRQMLSKVTDAVISVEGENVRQFAVVTIEEVKSGDWAIGGKPLGTDEVKAVIAGKQGKAA